MLPNGLMGNRAMTQLPQPAAGGLKCTGAGGQLNPSLCKAGGAAAIPVLSVATHYLYC